jgi:large subunit ribosomal protein L31e
VTQEYTINIHKHIHGMILRKMALGHSNLPWKRWGLQICELKPRLIKMSGPKEWGTFHIESEYVGPENVEYGNSPNKLYILVTYIPVTTFRPMVTVDEN